MYFSQFALNGGIFIQLLGISWDMVGFGITNISKARLPYRRSISSVFLFVCFLCVILFLRHILWHIYIHNCKIILAFTSHVDGISFFLKA